ncbi:MAG: demethoxyubiquinone hydroxylase family protein [Pseudomonadales bacterium]|jgi:ubiquinone biosynthesis monooxygenase Coq7|nr:demethoxyubiquinone hydroxylase family protein [Pseudomonadales bacterium]
MPALRQAPVAELPPFLLRELRSDHAGELGAVWIYRGILAVSRDPTLRAFAEAHRASEQTHLDFFLTHLPVAWHTKLGLLWRLAGWLLGAGPALLGPRAVYRTVAAVERFVDGHYADQITALESLPEHRWLQLHLQRFREDELHHRDDANARFAAAGAQGPARLAAFWEAVVEQGSAMGAAVARRV